MRVHPNVPPTLVSPMPIHSLSSGVDARTQPPVPAGAVGIGLSSTTSLPATTVSAATVKRETRFAVVGCAPVNGGRTGRGTGGSRTADRAPCR